MFSITMLPLAATSLPPYAILLAPAVAIWCVIVSIRNNEKRDRQAHYVAVIATAIPELTVALEGLVSAAKHMKLDCTADPTPMVEAVEHWRTAYMRHYVCVPRKARHIDQSLAAALGMRNADPSAPNGLAFLGPTGLATAIRELGKSQAKAEERWAGLASYAHYLARWTDYWRAVPLRARPPTRFDDWRKEVAGI